MNWLERSIYWRKASDARARMLLTAFAAAGCLMVAACSDSHAEPAGKAPSPSAAADTIRTIEATTQMHLKGVGIGVGNIWEEEFVPAGGDRQRGLTAGLFISVEQNASESRKLRVHAGQVVNIPGYRLHVVRVEPTRIRIQVVEVTQ
jgi:hypothetical protein